MIATIREILNEALCAIFHLPETNHSAVIEILSTFERTVENFRVVAINTSLLREALESKSRKARLGCTRSSLFKSKISPDLSSTSTMEIS